jgi:hypothetical protein
LNDHQSASPTVNAIDTQSYKPLFSLAQLRAESAR